MTLSPVVSSPSPRLLPALVGGGLAAGLGAWGLGAWAVGRGHVLALGGDYVPMAPLTALLFVAGGAGLMLAAWSPDSRRRRRLLRLLAGVVAAVAGIVGVELALGWDPAWGLWGEQEWPTVGQIPTGRISPATVVAFVLSAVGLLGWGSERWRRRVVVPAAGGGLGFGVVFALGYASGMPLLYGGTTVPMALTTALGFMALNGGMLWPCGRPVDRSPEGGADGGEAERALAVRLQVVGAVIGLLLIATGVVYLRLERGLAIQRVQSQLEAITRLKAQQIERWREERLDEARFLIRTTEVRTTAAALARAPEDEAAQARLREWLDPIRGGDRYESITVLDPAGRTLLALPAVGPGAQELPEGVLASALEIGEPRFTDLHRGGDGRLWLELVVPLPAGRMGATVAVIVLRVAPGHTLFPLVQSWPLPSRTAEALLVRREGGQVRYLSPLRERADAALVLAQSVRALGWEEPAGAPVRIVRDYRGVPVTGAAKAVAGTSWYLVAKLDQAEAFAALRSDAWKTGGLVLALVVAVGFALTFLWRQRQADTLARILAAERARAVAAARLGLVMRLANDVILLCDERGRIVEASDRAAAVYGHAPERMLTLTVAELRPPQTRAQGWENFAVALRSEGRVFATEHQRADGTVFPVEVSARPVDVAGRRHVLSIVRDITERRAHEAEIERLNRMYQVVSQVNQAIIRSHRADELAGEICRVLVEVGGFRLAWIGWHDAEAQRIEPAAVRGDAHGYVAGLRISTDPASTEDYGPGGVAFRENRIYVCNDFFGDPATEPWRERARPSGFRALIALPIRRDGQPVGLLAVYAAEAPFFGPREVTLLEEAAADLSLALNVLAHDEQLRRSEERFRAIFEHAEVGMFETTPDGQITRANRGLADLLGVPVGQLVRRHWADFLADGSRPPLPSAPPEEPVERRFGRAAVGAFWGLLHSRSERDPEGRVIGHICILQDITTQVEARETLERFNAELEAQVAQRTAELAARNREVQGILQAVPDKIMRLRGDGTVLYRHHAHAQMPAGLAALTSTSEAEAPFPRHPEVFAAAMETGRQALAANETTVAECEAIIPGGAAVVEMRAAPVARDEFVVFVRDITARKRLEAETVAMLEKERQVSEMKTRFISVTSHEFRTPMAAAMGSLELLANHLEHLAPAKRRELFERINGSLRRMTTMLDDVLTLNRLDARRAEVRLVPVDLPAFVHLVVEEVRHGDHGAHRFQEASAGEAAAVVTDTSLLHHILDNLLGNAVRYAPAGTVVSVEVEADPWQVQLAVADQGIGIPAGDRARIFEPFERGSNVGTVKGSGLGLSIVRRMTELLGGKISVASRPEGGTIFTLVLPRLKPPTDKKPA